MIRLLILVGCYASFWSDFPPIGKAMQAAFFPLFLIGAFYAISRKQILEISPSPAEIILYAAAVLSAVVGLFSANDFTIQYSMVFLFALILISIMSRAVSLDQLLGVGAVAALLGLLTSLLIDRHNLIKALSITMGRNGLFRFHPLHTHADLTGFIYGAGSILMARRAFVAKRGFERAAMVAGVLLAWTFVLAASSRGSVVALVVAAASALVLESRFTKATYWKLAGLGTVAISALSFLFGSRVLSYVEAMLALNSKYRGLSSGGSGRTEIWSQGITAIFADPIRLIFGGGLRSSEGNYFASGTTENSYITIVLDSGLFMGTAIIFVYIYSVIKALKLSRSAPPGSNPLSLLSAYFVFALSESFFNRDLMGIGNPGSLLILMILVSLSIHEVPMKQFSTACVHPDGNDRASSLPKPLA